MAHSLTHSNLLSLGSIFIYPDFIHCIKNVVPSYQPTMKYTLKCKIVTLKEVINIWMPFWNGALIAECISGHRQHELMWLNEGLAILACTLIKLLMLLLIARCVSLKLKCDLVTQKKFFTTVPGWVHVR